MREILFRGKRLDNGERVEGYLVKRPSAIQVGNASPWFISVPPVDPDDNGGFYNVDPSTVGQYTGLTDENGKEIFEGDILEFICEDGEPHRVTVVFDGGAFRIEDGGTIDTDLFTVSLCLGVKVVATSTTTRSYAPPKEVESNG